MKEAKMIDDIEIRSEKILQEYLKKQGFTQIGSINRSNQKKDPPDFDFYINGKKYAVEVTQTKSHRKAILDETPIIEKTYRYTQFNFIKDVEQDAIQKGILHGLYLVKFFDPIISQNFSRIKNQIKLQIFEYIYRTNSINTAKEELIYINDNKVANISKINNSINKICPTEFQGLWPESPEKIKICLQMIEAAVNEKKKKLLNNKINYPWILLLVNVSSHCIIDTYIQCMKKINEITNIEFFEAIFIIYDNYEILPFFIEEKSILNK